MEYKGFIVGKFAPFHIGHEFFIKKALEQCSSMFVIVSYDPRFDDKLSTLMKYRLELSDRLHWVESFCWELAKTSGKKITVDYVNEKNIPEYPNGWPEFIKLCLDCMKDKYFVPDAVFSSEPRYDAEYKKYLPSCKHIIIDSDRNNVNMSATKVREHLSKIDALYAELHTMVSHDVYTDLLIPS